MLIFLVLVIVILSNLYLYQKLTFWKRIGVLQNFQWIILGDLWDISDRFYHFLEKLDVMYRKYKGKSPIFGFYFSTDPCIIVSDINLWKHFLVVDFSNFMNRSVYIDEENDPLSSNLFSLEGEQWRHMRNNLTPTFTSLKMRGMYPQIEEKGAHFVQYLMQHARSGMPVDIKDGSKKYTADNIASVAFGIETNCLQTKYPAIVKALEKIFKMNVIKLIYLLLLVSFPSLFRFLKLRRYPRESEQFFVETMKSAIAYRDENKIKKRDFLDMLINLMRRGTISSIGKKNIANKLSFNQILGQAFTFFVVGYDTTATVINVALYLIAKHPEVQSKLRDEIRAVKAKLGGQISCEQLPHMTYLGQVVNETLRLYPPFGVLLRKSKSNYKVPECDLVIPSGTQVVIPVYSIHRDPEHYFDADRFNPDHFSPEEVAKRHPYAFLPFGDGPRSCIGMRFANMQVKYAVVSAVDNFEISVNARTKELLIDHGNPNITIKGDLLLDFLPI